MSALVCACGRTLQGPGVEVIRSGRYGDYVFQWLRRPGQPVDSDATLTIVDARCRECRRGDAVAICDERLHVDGRRPQLPRHKNGRCIRRWQRLTWSFRPAPADEDAWPAVAARMLSQVEEMALAEGQTEVQARRMRAVCRVALVEPWGAGNHLAVYMSRRPSWDPL